MPSIAGPVLPLLRQRLRGVDLRNRLVSSRPTGGRRVVDLGGGAALQLHGRHGAWQRLAPPPARRPRRIRFASSRCSRPALACWALLIPLVLPSSSRRTSPPSAMATAASCCAALVCALILTPPTMLMGATLPVIARWLRRRADGASRTGLDLHRQHRRRRRRHRAGGLLPAARLRHGHRRRRRGRDQPRRRRCRLDDGEPSALRSTWHQHLAPHPLAPDWHRLAPRRTAGPWHLSTSPPPCPASPRSAPKWCGPVSCRCCSAPASTRSR